MITKRVKKNNLMAGLARAVVCGALTEALFLLVILATGSWSRLLESLLAALCLTAFYLVLGWIKAVGKNHRFMKQLKKQDNGGVSLDEDSFAAVTKHVSLGANWLVFHQGNEVVPVVKSSIASVITDGRHAVLYNKDHEPVCVLKYGRKEEGLPDRIRQWIHVNKNSEYK